jgi:hypothetical protein
MMWCLLVVLPADGTRRRGRRGVVLAAGVAGLVVCGWGVRVEALGDVCEEGEAAAGLWVGEVGGCGLGEGRGVCLRHCEGVLVGLG